MAILFRLYQILFTEALMSFACSITKGIVPKWLGVKTMNLKAMMELNKAAIWHPEDITELCLIAYGV